MSKYVVAILLALATVTGPSALTSAAPKAGCPAEASGWKELSVADTAEVIYAGLLDTSPYDGPEDLEPELAALDRNNDGLCLVTRWGEGLNPKSHWYRVGIDAGLGGPVTLFLVIDNRAGAAGK